MSNGCRDHTMHGKYCCQHTHAARVSSNIDAQTVHLYLALLVWGHTTDFDQPLDKMEVSIVSSKVKGGPSILHWTVKDKILNTSYI